MKTCSTPNCSDRYYCTGLCKVHYNKQYREQHPEYFQKKSQEAWANNREYYDAKYAARQADPEKRAHDNARSLKYSKSTYLERRYGITEADLEKMDALQEGRCKICKKESAGRKERDRLYIDHCHETGRVRGLLCHQCNAGLGMFKDNIEALLAAVEYLRGSK